jgi:cytochrome c oxidase subunit II
MKTRVMPVLALSLLLGCAGHQQSALDPAGTQSDHINALWWSFFWILGIVFVIVMVVLLLTLTRQHPGAEQERHPGPHRPSEATESRFQKTVTAASIITIVILFALIVASVGTGKSIAGLGSRKNPLTIQVTANQWWWQFQYTSDTADQTLVTANEIHIPIGRPVQIVGTSLDVIHSFWVPNLHGKRDLIPSRTTEEWIEADRPGVYRGQCAEFCGLQHAHMAFWVIAEPEQRFEAWKRAQLEPAIAPATPDTQRGQQVFLNHACVYCHQIRGTTAAGQNAPDLTHFGSRRGIAANTLPNTKGNLAGWILDPQSVKPGNHMAAIAVNSTDLQPLIDYLESLR